MCQVLDVGKSCSSLLWRTVSSGTFSASAELNIDDHNNSSGCLDQFLSLSLTAETTDTERNLLK